MPKDALPERLQDPKNWIGTDDDVWYMRWRIPLKGLFAYGPRSNHWWAKWREFPLVLFALFGEGQSRWETSGGELAVRSTNKNVFLYSPTTVYLSRVQYWCRWSIQLQWPLFFAFHFYFKDTPYPANTDGKLVFFYIGAHRDGDKVYWFPSAYLGLNWK